MDAVIYTHSDLEYSAMKQLLHEEANSVTVFRDPLDGHGHYGYAFDLVIIALNGARGMNEVVEWADRYPDTQIIWITSDEEFVSVAIQKEICDFLIRPYTEMQFRKSVRSAILHIRLV